MQSPAISRLNSNFQEYSKEISPFGLVTEEGDVVLSEALKKELLHFEIIDATPPFIARRHVQLLHSRTSSLFNQK